VVGVALPNYGLRMAWHWVWRISPTRRRSGPCRRQGRGGRRSCRKVKTFCHGSEGKPLLIRWPVNCFQRGMHQLILSAGSLTKAGPPKKHMTLCLHCRQHRNVQRMYSGDEMKMGVRLNTPITRTHADPRLLLRRSNVSDVVRSMRAAESRRASKVQPTVDHSGAARFQVAMVGASASISCPSIAIITMRKAIGTPLSFITLIPHVTIRFIRSLPTGFCPSMFMTIRISSSARFARKRQHYFFI